MPLPQSPLTQSPPPLLLTRPAAASERFRAAWVARHGPAAPVVVSPVQHLRPLAVAEEAAARRVVVLTSENAVPGLTAAGSTARAWCVGDRTAEAARAAGYQAVSAKGNADDLVAAILRSGERGPFVHLRGRLSRGEVAARLAAAGLDCTEAVVYELVPEPLTGEALALFSRPEPVLLPLFSPASAERVSEAIVALPQAARLRVAAISPATAAAWSGVATERLAVAERPDAPAMLAALDALWLNGGSP